MTAKNKLLYIAVITAVFCIFISIGLGNFRSRQLAVNLLSDRVFAVVSEAEESIKSGQLKDIIESGTSQNNHYQELRDVFLNLREISGINDIYIMAKNQEEGKWYFVVDGMPADNPRYAPLGTVLKDIPIGLEKAIRGKTVKEEFYRNSRGTLVSSFIEIKDTDGEVLAVLGGDIDASRAIDFLYLTKYIQIGVFTIGIIIIGTAFILLRRGKMQN